MPLGVCAGIAPFNFPAMIPLWMFPVGIIAGKSIIITIIVIIIIITIIIITIITIIIITITASDLAYSRHPRTQATLTC